MTPRQPIYESVGGDLEFVHLPGYARYLLDNKIEEFVNRSLKVSREMNIPLLRYFAGIPDEKTDCHGD
ncbi:MAG: hypothetical protein WDN75_17345 [Bacteroidota bacterium]